MDAGSYLEKCTALAPEELPYIVSHFGEKPDHHMFDAKEEKFFRRVLFAQELDTEYQSYFSREIVRYYQKKSKNPWWNNIWNRQIMSRCRRRCVSI